MISLLHACLAFAGDWQHHRPASAHHEATLTFAMKQRNLQELEARLYEVSTPGSAERGKFWSFNQTQAFTANTEATAAVTEWVRTSGATLVKRDPHGHYLHARAPVSVWQAALGSAWAFVRSERHGVECATPAAPTAPVRTISTIP